MCFSFFFFNDTATTEIYTLSLHDALPISIFAIELGGAFVSDLKGRTGGVQTIYEHAFPRCIDRKSTRLNSSHGYISYAVFCLKKKKPMTRPTSAVSSKPSPVQSSSSDTRT